MHVTALLLSKIKRNVLLWPGLSPDHPEKQQLPSTCHSLPSCDLCINYLSVTLLLIVTASSKKASVYGGGSGSQKPAEVSCLQFYSMNNISSFCESHIQ